MQYEQNVSAEILDDWSALSRHANHLTALHAMETRPPGGEQILIAYSQAALRALSNGPDRLIHYQDQMAAFLAKRTDMTVESAQQLEWRIRQHSVGRETPDYPDAFTDPQRWYEVLDNTSRPDSELTSTVAFMLHDYTVQTNEPHRAAGVLLAASLFKDRYPADGAKVIDLGSSIDLILAQLKFNAIKPHVPRISQTTVEGEPLNAQVWRRTRELFMGQLALGESWGIDLKTDSDLRTSGWVIPGCLYPSEYGEFKTEGKLTELKALLKMPNRQFTRAKLHHERADFTSPEHMTHFMNFFGRGRADIVTSQTTWYQHSASEEQRIHLWNSLQLHRELLKPANGIEIRQEHAVPLVDDPNRFELTPVYGKTSRYNLLIRDMAKPDEGYKTYIEFSNGRLDACKIGQPLIDRMREIGLL